MSCTRLLHDSKQSCSSVLLNHYAKANTSALPYTRHGKLGCHCFSIFNFQALLHHYSSSLCAADREGPLLSRLLFVMILIRVPLGWGVLAATEGVTDGPDPPSSSA